MKTSSKKLAVLIGIASVGIIAAGCARPTPTPQPTPSGGGGGNGPVDRPGAVPNLRIGVFETNIRPDGGIDIEVRVNNTGLGTARRNSVVRISQVGQSRTTQLIDIACPPIGAGLASPLLKGLIPPGQLKVTRNLVLRAKCDAGNTVRETTKGERDNFADKELVYGPDIVAKGVFKDPVFKTDPTNLIVNAVVYNGGTFSTGPFSATAIYKVKETPVGAVNLLDSFSDWKVLETKQVASLPPGKVNNSLKFAFSKDFADKFEGRNIVVRVVFDREGRVAELSNGNNFQGASHDYPPRKSDINVMGLMAWWSNENADIHLQSLIANTGNTATGPFDSQWYRLPSGGPAGVAGVTGGSDDGHRNLPWQPLGSVLKHPSIPPKTFEFQVTNFKLPMTTFTPDAKEEGSVVVLKYEADPKNEIEEFTDLGPGLPEDPANPNQAPPNPNQQPVPSQVPAGATVTKGNGPNNSFIWNFQVPRLPRPDLAVRYLATWVSGDGDRMFIETGVSNLGVVSTGAFKVVVTVDGQTQSVGVPNLPPSPRTHRFGFFHRVTQAQRRDGGLNVQVRLSGSKSERADDNNTLGHRHPVPPEKMGPDITVRDVDLELVIVRKEGQPDKLEALVKYSLKNTGDEPTGPYGVNAEIAGLVKTDKDEDGILPGETVNRALLMEVAELQQPERYRFVFAKFNVELKDDANPKNNSSVSNFEFLPPRPPEKPAPLPDLLVSDISLRPTSTKDKVDMWCTITNGGAADAPSYRVAWFVNERRMQVGYSPGLRRGSSENGFDCHWLDYKKQANENGKLRVMVIVDGRNTIREEHEGNNWADTLIDPADKGSGLADKPLAGPVCAEEGEPID